ncbi:DEAD/DEAH box helicase [Candidatus Peregrinibacteria bacterium CG11_big_fil_rev_8_21_14_0_20_46_8]|nr:MAG: DEAD/DEAH box helicase [Candidatus Peregrinibacteria bacterium CG11_big_fil_rev_8_21_14_0_20_46_8]
MLNMGFKEELDAILSNTPNSKQTLLFSATMNNQVRRIADNYMKKPEEITIGNKNQGADNVQHFYYVVHEKDRYQALRRIADVNPDIHGLIFCRTRRETQLVADKLIADHYSAEAIHGEVAQEQRIHVLNRFRDKKIQLLVATDVAARGIDVKNLTHVINYNLPESGEAYVHRSGRTGRASSSGISLVIVNMREKHTIQHLERKVGKPFEKGRIPGGDEICEKQLFSLVDKICNIKVNEAQIGKYINFINKKFEDMSKEDLIKKFVSEEFNRFIEHYKDADDLNSNVSSGRDGGRDGPRNSSILFARFIINVGRDANLNVKDLLDTINSHPSLRGVEIGNIEIRREYTLFEIDEQLKDKVLAAFGGSTINRIKINIACEKTGLRSSRAVGRGGRGGGGRYGGGRGYAKSRVRGRSERRR